MYLKELYPAFRAASQAMAAVYNPVFEQWAEKFHLSSQEIFLLMAVPTFEPKPVDPAILNIRSPYIAPEHYRSMLRRLAAVEMIVSIGEDQYRMTQHGLSALKETLDAVYAAMSSFQSLPVIKTMDLASRLKDLADACMAAPDPPGIWCIQHVRRMDPGSRAPMMVRIDQFLSELIAFRDDAHLAAWRGYQGNGHAWDVLTYLWVEQEASLEVINRALQGRGNLIEQTWEAVDLLSRKDWVIQKDGLIFITPTGAEVRRTVESKTDRYYVEQFNNFSDVELEHTLELVKEHRKGLKP